MSTSKKSKKGKKAKPSSLFTESTASMVELLPAALQVPSPAALPSKHAYEAAATSSHRKSKSARSLSEDAQLTNQMRARLGNSVDDLDRNLAICQWLIETYVNYTSRFKAHISSGVETFDQKVLSAIAKAARPRNFSLNKRLSFDDALVMLQRTKLVHGDGAWLKVAGGRIQGIPGNRINMPGASNRGDMPADYAKVANKSGMVVDPGTGEIMQFCLLRWNANGNGLEFDHIEQAENMIYAAHTRDFDQTKGTTRMASIVNMLVDLAEVHDYTRLKIKLHSTFGFMLSENTAQGLPQTTETTDTDEDGETDLTARIDLNTAPWTLQAPEGAKLDLVESNQPSSEFLDYVKNSVRDAMLSMGIPYTYYDGLSASFSSRIADVNQFEYSISPERDRMRYIAEEWGDWLLADYCSEGGRLYNDMVRAGLKLEDVQDLLAFVHLPAPWVDAKKQLEGQQLAIATSCESIQRICSRQGIPWREIIDENAEVLAYAREKNVPIFLAQSGQEDTAAAADPDAETDPDA